MAEGLLIGTEIQDCCISNAHSNIGNGSQNLGGNEAHCATSSQLDRLWRYLPGNLDRMGVSFSSLYCFYMLEEWGRVMNLICFRDFLKLLSGLLPEFEVLPHRMECFSSL